MKDIARKKKLWTAILNRCTTERQEGVWNICGLPDVVGGHRTVQQGKAEEKQMVGDKAGKRRLV